MPDKLRLVLLSFLMLFVELALIRWVGSNVFYLSYFSNFILLGSFLGIGVGFLRANRGVDLFPWAAVMLAFLVAFVRLFPVTIDRSGSQLVYFGIHESGLPMWVVLPIIFVATAAVMSAIAQGVGRVFSRFDALEAYRLDILGSIAGIVTFSLLSFWYAPPVAWGIIAAILFVVLYVPSLRALQVVAVLALVVMLGRESMQSNLTWSPYYRIALQKLATDNIDLEVNGIPHQGIQSMYVRMNDEPLYFFPYARLHSNPLRRVLIIGAGNGSDTAIALAAGAKHIDAVEIDPRIYQLGRKLNPDRPFWDPRVTVYTDDGRAFLQRTHDRYDLILLALPDSLTLVSGQSSIRLESYLFTQEAMNAARAHLAAGGAFGMYNYYREEWLVDRFANTLNVAYGHPPCVDTLGQVSFALLMVGREPGNVTCDTTWHASAQGVPAPVSDDYPFPYLRDRSIPPTYAITLLAVLLISLIAVRAATGPLQTMAGYTDLFFMGAAFLLLETKSVVQFALLFGTTWFVNALVFIGVLLSVYAAVEVSKRVRVNNPGPLYAVLFVALALAWFVTPGSLLSLEPPLRFAGAVALAFAPIFLANVIFAQRFRNAGTSTVAFGANLLGAMVGGTLEYSSLLIGYRSLLIVVALLYAAAYLAGRRQLVGETPEAAQETPHSLPELSTP